MRASVTRITPLALILAMVMTAMPPAFATEFDDPSEGVQEPAVADERGTAPPLVTDAAIDELVAGPAADGEVLVEVGLAIPWAPEPGLSGASQRSQRADIARAQAQVRRELRGTAHRLVHEYESIPFLAGHLSAEAIERLRDSDAVASVEEPREAFPTQSHEPVVLEGDDQEATPTLTESTSVIGSDVANRTGWTGAGSTVAIIDTGVETTHEFFGGRVVAEACFSDTGDCPSDGTATGRRLQG